MESSPEYSLICVDRLDNRLYVMLLALQVVVWVVSSGQRIATATSTTIAKTSFKIGSTRSMVLEVLDDRLPQGTATKVLCWPAKT